MTRAPIEVGDLVMFQTPICRGRPEDGLKSVFGKVYEISLAPNGNRYLHVLEPVPGDPSRLPRSRAHFDHIDNWMVAEAESTRLVPEELFPLYVQTMSKTDGLNALAKSLWISAQEKGFHDNPVPMGELISNLHGEVSELWESYRKSTLRQPCDKAQEMATHGIEPLNCAEEELADIVIRALDTAHELGVDIEKAVTAKAAYNMTRSYKHGGKLA